MATPANLAVLAASRGCATTSVRGLIGTPLQLIDIIIC